VLSRAISSCSSREGNKKEACPRAQHRFHGSVTDTVSQYQHSNAGDSSQVYPRHFVDLSDGLLLEYAVARNLKPCCFRRGALKSQGPRESVKGTYLIISCQVHQDNKARTSSKLRCEACHEALGFVDERADGWRLWKWSLCVQLDAQCDGQTFPTEMFVSTQLLGLIENQAVRKFVIYNEDGQDGVAGMMVSHSHARPLSITNPLLIHIALGLYTRSSLLGLYRGTLQASKASNENPLPTNRQRVIYIGQATYLT